MPPLGDELPQGVLLEPIEHDPFVADVPASGNILAPESQPVSPWADSPIAKVGRLIGERGLAGAMPGRTIKPETLPDFWQRWEGMIGGLKAANRNAPTQTAEIKLEPVDHDPFTGAP